MPAAEVGPVWPEPLRRTLFLSYHTMPTFITSLLRPLRWILRLRHRCGYGIHSPFAFHLVTDVVYRPGRFYADGELQRLHATQPHPHIRLKDCRLLFRLANRMRPASCLLAGLSPQGMEARSLLLGSRHTQLHNTPCSSDMILCGSQWQAEAEGLLPLLSRGGLLVLTDIGSSRHRRKAWKNLTEMPQATVCFDLYYYGLIFNRPDLQRQHYKVNYY